MAQVTIYLPDQVEKKVRQEARRAHKSLSAYITELAGRGWAKGEAVALYNEALELIPQDNAGRRREVELKRAIDYAAFSHIGDARQARRTQEGGLSR